MAAEAMVSVGYEGKQYQIPADVARLNATQPGVARDYIEEMIAEKADRQARAKAQREESVEAEFTVVKSRLSELESKNQIIGNLQRENSSLKAAVEAQASQINALEDSGGVLGGANASARQTSFELSNAATAGAAVLAELQRAQERMTSTVDAMQIQLDALQDQFDQRAEEALSLGKTRMTVVLEASNRAVDEAARAEAVARQAEAVAAQALSDAKAAQSLSRNDITREQIMAMVQNEVRDSSPRLVNEAIDVIRADADAMRNPQ